MREKLPLSGEQRSRYKGKGKWKALSVVCREGFLGIPLSGFPLSAFS